MSDFRGVAQIPFLLTAQRLANHVDNNHGNGQTKKNKNVRNVITGVEEGRTYKDDAKQRLPMRWSRKIGQLFKVYSPGYGGIRDDEATEVHA